MSLRKTIGLLAVLAAGIGACLAWWARFVEPLRLQVLHVPVQLPRRHYGLAGTTIAFVTDTHVGPHFDASALAPVVERLEAIKPDIVLFGGDYICESPRFMRETAPYLGQMARTAKYGALAILGNHDVSNIRERIVSEIERQGIPVLANRAVPLETSRGTLWVAGIDDALLGKPDLDAAFRDVPPDAAAICLWHEGDLVAKAAPYGAFLQLSGHSHGGQVRLPGVGPVATPKLGRIHVRGRFRLDDMELYVSSGIGMYRPPVRLLCPPELTIVQLID